MAAAQGQPAVKKPRTIPDFMALKGIRTVAWITAYDVWQARLAEAAGIDGILVGDSLGNTELGWPSTLPVTVDDMVRHAQAVRRGAPDTCVIVDMPFMSYATREIGLTNAGRLMQETGADGVKLEGGVRVAPLVAELVAQGIPVMGHIGLTPQSVNVMGGYRVQGRTAAQAAALVEDAVALAQAGVFSMVLEGVPDRLAGEITRRVAVPTIGIGAGAAVDAQILVLQDALGISPRLPKFAVAFGQIGAAVQAALAAYGEAVRAGRFPDDNHAYHMEEAEWQALQALLARRDDH